jgi:GLPGLI family protein
MKNLISLVIAFIFSLNVNAQKTYVEYSVKPLISDTLKTPGSKLNLVTSAQSKVKFDLVFDVNMSVCFLQENNSDLSDINYKVAVILSGGGKKAFKNLQLKSKNYEYELAGQFFNVQVEYEEYKWVITKETKNINGFLCYKATATYIKTDKGKNFSREQTAIAWFTPKIPASFGPLGIDGLPGLVLEGSVDGLEYLYATKVILDYDDKKKSLDKAPKGKTVTEDEFDNFNAKLYNERN